MCDIWAIFGPRSVAVCICYTVGPSQDYRETITSSLVSACSDSTIKTVPVKEPPFHLDRSAKHSWKRSAPGSIRLSSKVEYFFIMFVHKVRSSWSAILSQPISPWVYSISRFCSCQCPVEFQPRNQLRSPFLPQYSIKYPLNPQSST